MPMRRELYPANWDQIAIAVKAAAGWECEQCGMPHDRGDFSRVLTVHHKDHNPANCSPENLIALCAPCHLDEERKWKRSARGRQGRLLAAGDLA
jgi:formate-dependent nitrite reductase cytochrome c552 subunit